MRPKVFNILIAFVVILLAICFWLKPKQAPPIISQPQAMAQTTNSPAASLNTSSQNMPVAVAPPTASAIPDSLTKTNLMSLPQVVRQSINIQNKPISFYGQVIDQDSNALSGADVKMSIMQLIPLPPETGELMGSKSIAVEMISGDDGRFEVHNEIGKHLGIRTIEKDGYELEPNRYGFGSTAGSFESPVIFKMWSTNIHEQLITGDKSFEVVPDGRSYFIDLTDGTISETAGGDLKVWIQYTNQVVQGQLYDWSAGIEAPSGGLFEVPQDAVDSGFLADPPFAMYSAPAGGYIPSFSHKGKLKGGQSGEIGNRFFYLQLKSGQEYGKMSINLFAPYGRLHPGLIRVSYAINPSGSRILR